MRKKPRFYRQRSALLIAISVGLRSFLAAGMALFLGSTVWAEEEVATPAPYAPCAFLIGEWNVGPIEGKPAAVAHFRWGPGKTCIWYSGALLVKGSEQPSWEGLLVWNGVHKNLDFLLVLDPTPGHLVQEQGTMHLEPDGTVVREITAFYSEGNPAPPNWDQPAGVEGATGQFRQTFKPDGPDRIRTAVMRKARNRWVPNFPGSDHLLMTRQATK